MSELKKYHTRIPLGDPDIGYTLWATINAAHSFREASRFAEAQLKIYVGLLQTALKNQQEWEINETEQSLTGGAWPELEVREA